MSGDMSILPGHNNMKKTLGLLPFALVLWLCTSNLIWANSIASQMTDNLLALETMQGVVVQKKVLPDVPGVDVVQNVIYVKPWKIRAEVTSPAAIKGSLFIYDGDKVIMWWPQEQLGIRAINVRNPDKNEVNKHLEHEVGVALHDYAFSLNKSDKVAGVSTNLWKVIPMTDDNYHHGHSVWMYDKFSIPLKVELYNPDKSLWYGMEYKSASFNSKLPDNPFAFEFPSNTLVMDWDFADPGISMDEAKTTMNFPILQPAKLPAGLKVHKMIKAKGSIPMLGMIMDSGATRVALYQSHSYGTGQLMRYGKEVKVGGSKGYLSFTGSFSAINWIKGKTVLTLVGNLSYPQMLAIADSVQ